MLRRKRKIYKQKQRKPEYKRRFFKKRSRRVGPKIYLGTQKYSRLERSPSIWPQIYLALFFILVFGGGYLFLFLDFWQIKEVNFIETDRLNTQKMEEYLDNELTKKKLWIIPANHTVLLNLQNLEKGLIDNFPEIKTAKLEKDWSRVLKVSLVRKKPALIWVVGDPKFMEVELAKSKKRLEELESFEFPDEDEAKEKTKEDQTIDKNELEEVLTKEEVEKQIKELQTKIEELTNRQGQSKYFIIDEEGVVGKDLSKEKAEASRLPIIYDRSQQEISNNQTLLVVEFIEILSQIKKSIKKNLGLEVVSFSLPSLEADELYVKVKDGWFIYLNLSHNLEQAIADFSAVYREKINNKPENMIKEYVDLRIKDKVFWF